MDEWMAQIPLPPATWDGARETVRSVTGTSLRCGVEEASINALPGRTSANRATKLKI